AIHVTPEFLEAPLHFPQDRDVAQPRQLGGNRLLARARLEILQDRGGAAPPRLLDSGHESGRDESEVSELRFDERKALFPRRRGGPALRTRLAGRGFVRGARFFGAGGRPAEQLLEQRAERFSVDRARSPAADRFLDGE